MKVPARSLSWIALAATALGLTGCIVIPSHRHFGPPRAAVIVTPFEGQHHGHGRHHGDDRHSGRHHDRYDDRYDDRYGPYRR